MIEVVITYLEDTNRSLSKVPDGILTQTKQKKEEKTKMDLKNIGERDKASKRFNQISLSG